MGYKKEEIVKMNDGRIVRIINLPTSFMANGSYEVVQWVDGLGDMGKVFWVKPEELMYSIKTEMIDDINHYFEVIWDEDGLNLVPKDLLSVNIKSDREDFNRIEFNCSEGSW
jgi:hypothetical protein